jgi:hypothetical protein
MGSILAFIGFCMVLYYWLVYDTSVALNPGVPIQYQKRVHNIGLMQDRQVGIMVGVGVMVVGFIGLALGVVLFVVGRRRTRDFD